MALFEFNVPGEAEGPVTTSIAFTENSVNFTISTTGNDANNQLYYSPSANIDGQISISDNGAVAPWTLDVTNPASNFSGNLSIRLGSSISGSWRISLPGTLVNFTTVVTSANAGNNIVISGVSEFTAIKFIPLSGANPFITIDNLNATLVCYLEDTGIETTRGRVLVQDLKAGDRLPLAAGGETEVKWVGVQPIDGRTAHPGKVNPICISAGAIAAGVPSRDLFVSPDHAVEIDGLLFNASALVNGSSIRKVASMPESFTYYHIETDTHELILAEGLASESYLDNPDRSAFINGDERSGAPMIREMALPRIIAPRMVPADIRARLEERAAGMTMDKAA